MKKEWKKEEKELYLPKNEPVLIQIPKMNFFVVDGKGDPNTSKSFEEDVQALYSLSYCIRMMPKGGTTPKGYYEYTVYPMEGVWDVEGGLDEFDKLDKNKFIYSLMIRQPDFVDKDFANKVIEMTMKKKPNPSLSKVRFETIEDGLCVQMLHIGSYDDEPGSFNQMMNFCESNNLKRKGHKHREIYISDPRKNEPEKMKTTLRFWVDKK
jgi:hypothetical protein